MRGPARVLVGAPFSLAYAGVLILMAAATGIVHGPGHGLRSVVGVGYEAVVEQGHWWSPLSAVLFVDNGAQLIVAVLAVLVVLGSAERLMGTARTVVAVIVPTVVGTGLGVLLQSLGVARGEFWSRGVERLGAVDPFTAIAGAVMCASWFAGPLWRRRIRVVTVAVVLVFLLYSGQPDDLYRLLAALVGLALGALLRRGPLERGWRRSSHHETRTLLAAVVGVLAVGPAVTLLSGARFGLLSPLGLLIDQDMPTARNLLDRCLVGDVTPQCVHELTIERGGGIGPVLVSVLPLAILVVAAIGLARGSRFAAELTIVVNVALAALAAWYFGLLPATGQPYLWHPASARYREVAVVLVVSAAVPLIVAVVVALQVRRFPVRSAPGRRRRFVLVVIAAFVLLAGLYVSLGWLLRDRFRPPVHLADLLADAPERFIPVAFLRLERVEFLPGDWMTALLYHWVGPLFWLVVVVAAVLVIRSGSAGAHVDGQPGRLRGLLHGGGGGSLAFMTTWIGNTLWFDSTGRVAIAYRVVNRVALTVSEPVGPREAEGGDAERAVAEFSVMCDDRGWTPVFYSVHESWRPVFERMGWQLTGVGEETVLRPRSWSTTGKKWQDIRSSINRAERAGVRAEWLAYHSLTVRQASQISAISERWVQERGLPELGFTLGGLDELRDPEVRLMVAIDGDDIVHAVTSWLPSYRDGIVVGWTLDFMRRSPDSIKGVTEFLIARTAEMLREDPAIEFLSLSAAPLAQRPDGNEGQGVVADLLDFLGRSLEPVYGCRSLFDFKRKFQPELQPLYMAYPDPLALPAIGLALARAYLPSVSLRSVTAVVRSAPSRG
ncbi:bifunctional lysylphosphatidylglycerol flippase/synthetase MprF [Compostimonas suwonensis]|uniref:Lysylphosphatidylglycerol synthetase-like protein (DUF2156 family) n=1 Tax=Compostimonas suwonensis TaxID=1048394 RepID=A0A2M9C4Y6_9MICO|nr:DUF2156 domain-containing protein [Compostimonas suwonensis]PJJ65572.1 lysylphosphatidylglycerol synthetase-like protein (DUF2156 family) [Compostimonas suwonensis]